MKRLAVLGGFLTALTAVFLTIYLVVLPKLVASPKVHNLINNAVYDCTGANIVIKNPVLKTKLSPIVEFWTDDFEIIKNNKQLFVIKNVNTKFSFAKILYKNFKVKTLGADYIYADVNGLLSLVPKTNEEKETAEFDWNIDFYDSLLYIKDMGIIYDINKDTNLNINASNLKIDNAQKKCKFVHFDVKALMQKGNEKVAISIVDENKVYIKKKTLFIDDCKLKFNKSVVNIAAQANKRHHNLEVYSNKFEIKNIIDLVNSNLIIPNGFELLSMFKDIKGNFDFRFQFKDKKLNGDVNLNTLSLILAPINDVPIQVHKGKINITTDNITLSGFEGYYGTRKVNALKLDGTIKDYVKTIDTNIEADAVVTNDFAKYYLSEMIGYPLEIIGKADTKLVIKSKNGIVDLKWLFKISPNDNLLIGGEPLSKYKMERVVVSDFHIDKNIMDIKGIDYYVTVPNNEKYNRRQIMRLVGKIDFSKGVDFREMGFDVSEPLPSEFLNVLIRQSIFKSGTVIGKLKAIDGPKGVKLFGDIKLDKIRIPSQRLYVESGNLSTNFNTINIVSNGRYRRSKYNLSGNFVNNIAFPIIVNGIDLSLDEIDIEKLMRSFNSQGTDTIVVKNTEISDDDEGAPTFDLGNLIIKKCTFNLNKGAYKDILFGNLHANMSLDEKSKLELDSNRFDFAEGHSSAHVCCDLKNHKYHVKLGAKDVNSDIIATSLLDLKKEISGKASGLIDINTDATMKLNGNIKFAIKDGTIGKIGLIEYVLNVASVFRNPLAMVSPATIMDLINVPEGKFEKISGELNIKNNVIEKIKIKSAASNLSAYIAGRFDLEKRDATLRIYTKFSSKNTGIYGILRNFSLSSIASRVSLSGSRNDYNYYSSELSEIPDIEADEKDCQIFLTKVDGDVEHNNFLSSLKKIK
ncbi:MAG: hypothetical protein NC200_05615 [Candidatus Gastranaerophilales bacterium]|nr:hypothetical protein [Candidatus Gastranaerophilales bacterium]